MRSTPAEIFQLLSVKAVCSVSRVGIVSLKHDKYVTSIYFMREIHLILVISVFSNKTQTGLGLKNILRWLKFDLSTLKPIT